MLEQNVTNYIVELRRRADGRINEIHNAEPGRLPSATFEDFKNTQRGAANAERRVADDLEKMLHDA